MPSLGINGQGKRSIFHRVADCCNPGSVSMVVMIGAIIEGYEHFRHRRKASIHVPSLISGHFSWL